MRYLKQGHIWCFTLNRNWAIDAAVDGNAARFINHSCRGNCYVQIIKGVIWIRASRPIRKGEELSYNYNTDGAAEIPCRCRPGCQGMSVGGRRPHGGGGRCVCTSSICTASCRRRKAGKARLIWPSGSPRSA